MSTTQQAGLTDRLDEALRGDRDLPELAQVVYTVLSRHVPYVFACFATTDPTTGLITWTSKTRSLGVGDEEFAAAEYGPPDVNSFAEIARRSPAVGALCLDTDGDPVACRRQCDFLHPRFGFTDELRVVFLSRSASWGVMAIYRGEGDPDFTASEASQLGAVSALVADAVQRSLFCRRPPSPTEPRAETDTGGPAVIIVDIDDKVTHLTPAAQGAVEELGGWEHGSLPANVLAVVANTRTPRRTPTPGRRASPVDG